MEIKEKVMDVLYLILTELENEEFKNNIISNVCEEHNLKITDVFPVMQLMESKYTIISYLFHAKADSQIKKFILDEVKNQIIEYISENQNFYNDVIELFLEYYSGNIKEFLLNNNLIEIIKTL